MPTTEANLSSLTALLGTPITDRGGRLRGRLKDVAVATGAEAGHVAGLILKTGDGSRLAEVRNILQTPSGALELRDAEALQSLRGDENFLLLQQDIVDQQIVDVHGRKVVRANDVNLQWFSRDAVQALRVTGVEVGAERGDPPDIQGNAVADGAGELLEPLCDAGYSVGIRGCDRG